MISGLAKKTVELVDLNGQNHFIELEVIIEEWYGDSEINPTISIRCLYAGDVFFTFGCNQLVSPNFAYLGRVTLVNFVRDKHVLYITTGGTSDNSIAISSAVRELVKVV